MTRAFFIQDNRIFEAPRLVAQPGVICGIGDFANMLACGSTTTTSLVGMTQFDVRIREASTRESAQHTCFRQRTSPKGGRGDICYNPGSCTGSHYA